MMVGSPSFFDLSNHYAALSAARDLLERLAAVVDFEVFRGPLVAALPRVGFIVTELPMGPDWLVQFNNQRGTPEQHTEEGKYAFRWTRLPCWRLRDNDVRLRLHALAYNLGILLALHQTARGDGRLVADKPVAQAYQDGAPRSASRLCHLATNHKISDRP
jgi:hypothetical protein